MNAREVIALYPDCPHVVLVKEEDIAFIHQCWENKVYPRGWSEEDEHTK
jgi:hypothetical protein